MVLEIALILIAALALACHVMIQRKQWVFHEEEHHERLICVISFYDRSKTLPKIEAFFEQEYITVRDLKREIKRVGDRDLFTNTYLLGMPRRVDQGRLVAYLSAIDTVQSVQIRPQ